MGSSSLYALGLGAWIWGEELISRLLGNYQHSSDSGPSSGIPQTDIYASYASRFANLSEPSGHPNAANPEDDLSDDVQINEQELDSLNLVLGGNVTRENRIL
jgi:hypothetical protein